jgi:hypothetical protein
MDSAELTALKPRKASPLTTGEYTEVLSLFSALTVCISGKKQTARNSANALDPDMMEFDRNIRPPSGKSYRNFWGFTIPCSGY